MQPEIETKPAKPWQPTHIEMTTCVPFKIRSEAQRLAWKGGRGPARGLTVDTTRRVVDDKEAGVRTIHNARRGERLAARVDRFSVAVRATSTDARLERKRIAQLASDGRLTDSLVVQLAYRQGYRRDVGESDVAFANRTREVVS